MLKEQAPYLDGLYFHADNAPHYHCSQILYQLPGAFTQFCAQTGLCSKCLRNALQTQNGDVHALCAISLSAARLLSFTVHHYRRVFASAVREQGFRLLAMWHNEPGEGKDLVDALFNAFKTPARVRINSCKEQLIARTSVHLACIASLQTPRGMLIGACLTMPRQDAPPL